MEYSQSIHHTTIPLFLTDATPAKTLATFWIETFSV